MKKLILILLAFLAIFTLIRALETAQAGEIPSKNTMEIFR
ncbi:hypothetical protein R84B8_03094 [Treponema sp. R8-4-B8]